MERLDFEDFKVSIKSTSVPNTIASNRLLSERIEILRGPSALLYGTSAVGGVVNVIDTRIPRTVPENGYRVNGIANYGSAANERSGGMAGDVAVGPHLVLHADGSYLKSGDLRTGGYILSPALRAEARASSDANIRALADLKGDLPNSAAKSSEIAGGVAYIDGRFNIGASIARFDNLYGAPVRYSLDVGLSGGGLFATGEVGVDMKLQCVKCLEQFEYPIEVQDFACQVELGATETVDLTDPVREDILLALPAHPHCDWDGGRTCPGASLVETSDPEQDATADTRDTWGALDQIKFRR